MKTIFWFVIIPAMTLKAAWDFYSTLVEGGHVLRLSGMVASALVLGGLVGTRVAIWALKPGARRLPIISEEPTP